VTDDAAIIELAAQAIRACFANRSGQARPWHEIPRTLRESHRQEARSALKAARDCADGLLVLCEEDRQVAIEDAEKAKQPTISQRAQMKGAR
jgi:hypothetical protein